MSFTVFSHYSLDWNLISYCTGTLEVNAADSIAFANQIMLLSNCIAAWLALGVQALVLRREEIVHFDREFPCQENTWGGCCIGVDERSFGTGCSYRSSAELFGN